MDEKKIMIAFLILAIAKLDTLIYYTTNDIFNGVFAIVFYILFILVSIITWKSKDD